VFGGVGFYLMFLYVVSWLQLRTASRRAMRWDQHRQHGLC
jgi:hypothetical protein